MDLPFLLTEIYTILIFNSAFSIKILSDSGNLAFDSCNRSYYGNKRSPALASIHRKPSKYIASYRPGPLSAIPISDHANNASKCRLNEAKYFADLLNNNIKYTKELSSSNYDTICAAAKNSIIDAISAVVDKSVEHSFTDLSPYNTKDASALMDSTNAATLMIENLLLGIALQYINMTDTSKTSTTFWFFRTSNNNENRLVRLQELLDLLLKAQDQLFVTYRQCITNLKLLYTSKLFYDTKNDKNADLLKLTQNQYILTLQKDFMRTIAKLVPFFFKIENYKGGLTNAEYYRKFIELTLKAIEFPSNTSDLLTHLPELTYERNFTDILARWSVEKDLDEFKQITTNLSTGAKKLIHIHLDNSVEKDKLMKLISDQQQQIELYQKQLSSSSHGSQFNCGFAYRMPDSNLNISGTIQRGKANLQISCVPDESAHLLGPYGFTHGVFPGNLGLSFNINI